jgi:hypothetical protein
VGRGEFDGEVDGEVDGGVLLDVVTGAESLGEPGVPGAVGTGPVLHPASAAARVSAAAAAAIDPVRRISPS